MAAEPAAVCFCFELCFSALHIQRAGADRDDNVSLLLGKPTNLAVFEIFITPDDKIVIRCTVADVARNPAVRDLCIPQIELFMQYFIKTMIALDNKVQVVASVGFGGEGDAVHHILQDQQEQSAEQDRDVHSRADGKTDAGCHPDSGGGGQSPDITSDLEDDACTQKADAADDLCRDPCGICSARSKKYYAFLIHEICKAVLGDQHQKGCCHADQYMGPDSGFLEAMASFKSDDSSYKKSDQEAKTEIQILDA